jgi:hypothetical protein
MGESDLQDDVRELRKQVEALREVLGKVAEPYREIAGYLDRLQTITVGPKWDAAKGGRPSCTELPRGGFPPEGSPSLPSDMSPRRCASDAGSPS